MISDALVYAFIVATENNDIAFQRQFVGYMLVELFTVRTGINHLIIVAFGFEG